MIVCGAVKFLERYRVFYLGQSKADRHHQAGRRDTSGPTVHCPIRLDSLLLLED